MNTPKQSFLQRTLPIGSVGYYVFLEWGVAASGGWKVAWPIPLGVVYGVCAIGFGLRLLARLAWTWNAPLRGLRKSPR